MVAVNSSMVTEARRNRKLGAIGASDEGTNTSACTRSIAVGRRPKRAADIERHIGEQTEHDAVDERRQIETEQRLRPQPGDAERSVGEDARANDAGVRDARQQ